MIGTSSRFMRGAILATVALCFGIAGGNAEGPSGVPHRAKMALAEARKWESDAVLDTIQINGNQLVFFVHSPSARKGQTMVDTGGGFTTMPFDVSSSTNTTAIGTDFVDLPQAIAAARAAGFSDSVGQVVLLATAASDSRMVAAWHIGRYLVDASSGKVMQRYDPGQNTATRSSQSGGQSVSQQDPPKIWFVRLMGNGPWRFCQSKTGDFCNNWSDLSGYVGQRASCSVRELYTCRSVDADNWCNEWVMRIRRVQVAGCD